MHSGMAKQDLQSSWDLQSGLEVLVEGVVLGGVEGLVGWAIVWYPRARKTRKHLSMMTAGVVTDLSIGFTVLLTAGSHWDFPE